MSGIDIVVAAVVVAADAVLAYIFSAGLIHDLAKAGVFTFTLHKEWLTYTARMEALIVRACFVISKLPADPWWDLLSFQSLGLDRFWPAIESRLNQWAAGKESASEATKPESYIEIADAFLLVKAHGYVTVSMTIQSVLPKNPEEAAKAMAYQPNVEVMPREAKPVTIEVKPVAVAKIEPDPPKEKPMSVQFTEDIPKRCERVVFANETEARIKEAFPEIAADPEMWEMVTGQFDRIRMLALTEFVKE